MHVNWKAAATVVTGATALAGWLTSPSPAQAPVSARARSAQVRPRAVQDHGATIEKQSLRLATRLRPAAAFTQPQRDPFHFGARRNVGSASGPAARRAPAAVTTPAAIAAQAPPFPYRLSGVASDTTADRLVRTAVLAGGVTGLVLAVVGETVDSIYRVERIDEAAVVLTDTRDGRAVTLTLATP